MTDRLPDRQVCRNGLPELIKATAAAKKVVGL